MEFYKRNNFYLFLQLSFGAENTYFCLNYKGKKKISGCPLKAFTGSKLLLTFLKADENTKVDALKATVSLFYFICMPPGILEQKQIKNLYLSVNGKMSVEDPAEHFNSDKSTRRGFLKQSTIVYLQYIKL